MNLNDIMKKVYQKLQGTHGRHYRHEAEEAKKYIMSFRYPKDDIERSFFQYKCQKWDTIGRMEFILANIASMILLLPKFIQFRHNKAVKKEIKDAVLTLEALSKRLPEDFSGTYVIQAFEKGSLSKEDIVYLKEIYRRYPLSFYFIYKVMCRVASYSKTIRENCPQMIFASAEYSFTSSILTAYCEEHNVQHINIMHGEKEFNPREAFSRFTKFYIWDEYYKELFHSLRADMTEYVITPIKTPDLKVINYPNRCKYYLQLHTREQLSIIKSILENSGLDYMVRPHPIYSRKDECAIFGIEHVESNNVDIWESIREAGYAISQDSTVLYQAYCLGAKIVIDDVSDPVYYRELCNRGYIMLHKPRILLSEIKTII